MAKRFFGRKEIAMTCYKPQNLMHQRGWILLLCLFRVSERLSHATYHKENIQNAILKSTQKLLICRSKSINPDAFGLSSEGQSL